MSKVYTLDIIFLFPFYCTIKWALCNFLMISNVLQILLAVCSVVQMKIICFFLHILLVIFSRAVMNLFIYAIILKNNEGMHDEVLLQAIIKKKSPISLIW